MGEYYQNPSWKITAQQDLPYLPTPSEVIEAIFEYLQSNDYLFPDLKLIDLGAGNGRVIIHAAEKYGINSIGVEVNEELIHTAQEEIQAKNLQEICRMEEGDLYAVDVSEMDVVFVFILPSSHRYFKHVIESIKPNAVVISIRWPLDVFKEHWAESHQISPLKDFPGYIYRKKAD